MRLVASRISQHSLGQWMRPRRLKGKVEILSGRWLVERNELVQTDAGDVAQVYFGRLHWTDYDFTVEVREKGNGTAWLDFRRVLRNGNHIGFELGNEGMVAIEDGKVRELGRLTSTSSMANVIALGSSFAEATSSALYTMTRGTSL